MPAFAALACQERSRRRFPGRVPRALFLPGICRPSVQTISGYISCQRLYGRLPFAKIVFGVLGQIGCSSISGLLCRQYLLALMESADPRLILLKDSKSLLTYRLGGSRSDLFAITLSSTLRNLYGGHSFLKVVDTPVSRLYRLTDELLLVRPLMGEHCPDRPRHLVGQCHDGHIQRPALA